MANTITIIGGSAASIGIITSMANIALGRIGANNITDINEASPNAIKAAMVYEYVRDEVLQQKDWRFAKIRAALVKNATAPLYGHLYAYTMPSDFLRLARSRHPSTKGTNPEATPSGEWYRAVGPFGEGYYPYDPPVYPAGLPYIIEALPSGALVLMTDYDNTDNPLYINYIRKVTDATKYTPTFKTCLIYRWAEEMSVAVTENAVKSRDMAMKYREYLNSAEAVNESSDFLEDETGSSAWEDAGR